MENYYFEMKQRPKFRGTESQEDNLNNKINNEDDTEMTIKVNNERTIETPIKDGDTLQSLSIHFRCSVSELKRLNNLHRDNEIFARRTIKVPYRAYAVAAVHKSGENSPGTPTKKTIDAQILKDKLTSVTTINHLVDLSPSPTDLNEIIFNTSIANIEECENEQSNDDEYSDEEIELLPNRIEVTEIETKQFSCSGADWGMSWPILLGIILMASFIGPIIYVIYIAEHPEKYHHHVHQHHTV